MDFLELFGFFARITWLPAICFIAGFGLIIFEMFNPGFGVPGIAGLILLFLGILFVARSLTDAIIMVLILLAVLGIALVFILRSASRGKLSKTVVLSDTLNRDSGFIGTENLESFLGKEGEAITVLRPAGVAEIEGARVDVVSQSEFLPKGTKIKVVKVEGRRVVVADINQPDV
jgi:membrane-bound ClpP family serine protease